MKLEPVIPNDPPETIQSAGRFYWDKMGWAIHPLFGPNSKNCSAKQRGKAPVCEGWPSHTAAQITEADISQWFGNGHNYNLGVVVRRPFVVVDLDSKTDNGASVRKWLEGKTELASVPHESTAGGVHLHFICHDLPTFYKKNGKLWQAPLSCVVSLGVTAELFFEGQNIVVSPSVHPSGHHYQWTVKGRIPEITWAELQRIFGFKSPDEEPQQPSAKKSSAWWLRFKGDLRSLDVVALCKEAKLYGHVLDADEGKHAVRCPWADQHSNGEQTTNADSSTVVFEGKDGNGPGWKCLHNSHGEKTWEDLLLWIEARFPGLVDKHCSLGRVFVRGQKDAQGRLRIVLPGLGHEISTFAEEIGRIAGPKNVWFIKGDEVVDVRLQEFAKKVKCVAFHALTAVETRSLLEEHVQTGILTKDENEQPVFVSQSVSRESAAALLEARQFQKHLPRIERILDVPVPMFLEGKLVYPKQGYDEALKTFCRPSVSEIRPVPLEQGKQLLLKLHEEFCFKDELSKTLAIARLLTSFSRGLMGWDARMPVWVFEGNRPRAGKDYMAAITQIVFEGHANEDAPLDSNSEETCKRIMSALRAGRRRMHFANCKGHVDNSVFEQAVTSKVFSARALGNNDGSSDKILPNEIEFSLSANVGFSFTEDFDLRCRRISLHYAEEDANARKFKTPDLHGWVLGHRAEVLGALAGLVQHWFEQGCPDGPLPFTSFPEWARVVGGIMTCCGLGDPCAAQLEGNLTGDSQTQDMKTLFQLAYEAHPEKWIQKKEIYQVIENNADANLFPWWDLNERKDQTKFGKQLVAFRGRILGGIQLALDGSDKSRLKYRFGKVEGGSGAGSKVVNIDKTVLGLCEPCEPCEPLAPSRLSENILPLHNKEEGKGPPGVCGEVEVRKVREVRKEADEISPAPDANSQKTCFVGETVNQQGVQATPHRMDGIRSVVLITDPKGLNVLADRLATQSGPIALDLETYGPGKGDGLNPRRGEIRLVTLCVLGSAPWIIDLKRTGYPLGRLAAELQRHPIIIHNAKFDMAWLRQKCGLILQNVVCTMTLSRLLTAGSKEPNDLAACLDKHLGIVVDKTEQTGDWGVEALTESQYDYAARDVVHLHALAAKLQQEITAARLTKVAELENAILPIVVGIESNGFMIDRQKLERVAAEAKSQAETIRQQVCEAFGKEINPGSPAQVQTALKDLGIDLPSTSEEMLINCNHPAAKLVLEYRALEKTRSAAETYLEAAAADGRIHAQFNPTGTETGRFSCKEPNLQNVGRDRAFRACFIAAPGSKLVVADYSQIELRAAAYIAKDQAMLNAYQNGADVHTQTAALVLQKNPGKVTKEDRQLAKAVNFGLIYGQREKGLCKYAKASYGVTLTEADATVFRRRFFQAYRQLDAWHQYTARQANNGVAETRTLIGRRRLLPGGKDNWWQRYSSSLNTPVQGSCGDGLKLALLHLAKELPPEARIVSLVHDEVIVEVPAQQAEDTAAILKKCMIAGMAEVLKGVPVEVDVKIGDDWACK